MTTTYQITTNDMLKTLQRNPMTRVAASRILPTEEWGRFMRSPHSPKWFSAEDAERVLSLLVAEFVANHPAAVKELREATTDYCKAICERFGL